MQVKIALVDGDPDELYSLSDWLQNDDELRGRITMIPREQDQHEMGALTDALVVSLGGGGAAGALVTTLSTWLSVRRTKISIEITTGDTTRRAEVDAQNAAEAQRLLRIALDTNVEAS